METCIWEKFIFISSFGLVTAAYDKSIGEVLEDSLLWVTVSEIIAEVVSIAGKLGIALPGNCSEASIEKGGNFPYETKTSFQRDFERVGKSDERDLFAGTILRYASELKMEVPATLKAFERLEQIKPSR